MPIRVFILKGALLLIANSLWKYFFKVQQGWIPGEVCQSDI